MERNTPSDSDGTEVRREPSPEVTAGPGEPVDNEPEELQNVAEILVTDDQDIQDEIPTQPLSQTAPPNPDLLVVPTVEPTTPDPDFLTVPTHRRGSASSGDTTPDAESATGGRHSSGGSSGATTPDASLLAPPSGVTTSGSSGSTTPDVEMLSASFDDSDVEVGKRTGAIPKKKRPLAPGMQLIVDPPEPRPGFVLDPPEDRPSRPTSIGSSVRRTFYDFTPDDISGSISGSILKCHNFVFPEEEPKRKRRVTDPADYRSPSSSSGTSSKSRSTSTSMSCHTSMENLTDYVPTPEDELEYLSRRTTGPSVTVICSPGGSVSSTYRSRVGVVETTYLRLPEEELESICFDKVSPSIADDEDQPEPKGEGD